MWIAISITDGIRDAWYFHRSPVGVQELPKDIHVIFQAHRLWIGVSLITLYSLLVRSAWDGAAMALTLIMLFPYWHDGTYYLQRDLLKPGTYPHRFYDQSKDTSARVSLNFPSRFLMMAIGIAFITIYHILR